MELQAKLSAAGQSMAITGFYHNHIKDSLGLSTVTHHPMAAGRRIL